jgi:hypothetical protein
MRVPSGKGSVPSWGAALQVTPVPVGLLSASSLVSTQSAPKKMARNPGTGPMPVISRDVKRHASRARSIQARSASGKLHAGGA